MLALLGMSVMLRLVRREAERCLESFDLADVLVIPDASTRRVSSDEYILPMSTSAL
jgi:hypothetical protein